MDAVQWQVSNLYELDKEFPDFEFTLKNEISYDIPRWVLKGNFTENENKLIEKTDWIVREKSDMGIINFWHYTNDEFERDYIVKV